MERVSKTTKEIVVNSSGLLEQGSCGEACLSQEIMVKCLHCRELLYVRDWERNLKVCQYCQYHFHLSASERIALLLDAGSFVESDSQMRSADPLRFNSCSQSYAAKLEEAERRTGLYEAVVIGRGRIEGYALALAIMDFRFIGGSMGSVVGEKITRCIEMAEQQCLPLLIISASGGARIQEGIFSLMQMAKISVALARLSEAHLPFFSLLTDPTTGGAAASFAMRGDVILAEPGALIGFAGPRVIAQFLHQQLPADTDTSEFALAHGMIDAIIPRHVLRPTLARLLAYYRSATCNQEKCQYLPADRKQKPTSLECTAARLYQQRQQLWIPKVIVQQSQRESRGASGRWEQVQLARHGYRPHTEDYIKMIGKNFFELRGDRRYADDQAILGGVITIAGRTTMLIGHQKGRDSRERLACNFGMPRPEGYRKAQRLMRQAEKFNFPVICLIDTPGASPDLASEQRGQAQAIAESLEIMATLGVPVVSVIIGEGGSGGALALALADRVFMLEHAVYTVAAPEAAASILWRDNALAAQAAEAMQVSAQDLLRLGVIDGIIREPVGGAQLDYYASAQFLTEQLCLTLAELTEVPINELLEQRYTKFRCIGCQ